MAAGGSSADGSGARTCGKVNGARPVSVAFIRHLPIGVTRRIQQFLRDHGISGGEAIVPDMAGIARGKILPAQKFTKSVREYGLRLPESIFLQTVTGEYPDLDEDDIGSDEDPDIYLRPDPDTVRMVPWYSDPTAQVIHDAFNADDTPVQHSSRYVLKKVLELYDDKGWKPIVAPELEFYLVSVNTDPDLPLVPPTATLRCQ